MADGAAESTKELTEEGAKVTTVAEGTDATAAPPAEPVASPPESIAIFFDGEPMAGKAETWTTEHVADAATLQFVGPHALPLPLFDKAGFSSAMGNLVGSFPDLTFNSTKVAPTKQEDGSWAADIVVTGTHTGAAFTPMADKLPAIETTGTAVSIGPETFTVWADEAGKVTPVRKSSHELLCGRVDGVRRRRFDFHTGRQDRDRSEGGRQPARAARLLPRHRRRHLRPGAAGRRWRRPRRRRPRRSRVGAPIVRSAGP